MSFPAHKTNASTQTEKRVFSVPATAALLNLELFGKNILELSIDHV